MSHKHLNHEHTALEIELAEQLQVLQINFRELEEVNDSIKTVVQIQRLALLKLLPNNNDVIEVKLPKELQMGMGNGHVVDQVAIFRDGQDLKINPIK